MGTDLWVKTMDRDPKQVLTEWLVLSAQSGSEAAFKQLHDLWRADLRRLCLVRVGRDEDVGEILKRRLVGDRERTRAAR